MKNWKQFLTDTAQTGKIAGAATAIAAATCGLIENGNAIAPINAVSHIAFGDEAARQDNFSMKYTLSGLALNDSANLSWAALYEVLFGRAADAGNVPLSLLGGALVSGIAYVVDYRVVPPRLTPGLELRLSKRSLLVIYVVLALALGVGALSRRRK